MSAHYSGRVGLILKFHPPTNTRGQRISVRRGDGSLRKVYGWDYALGHAGNYTAAVDEYIKDMDWDGRWVVATTHDGAQAVRVPEEVTNANFTH